MREHRKTVDKPTGQDLGWKRLDTRYPYRARRFTIRQDQVQLPNGTEVDYAYTESDGALWIVPVTATGQVILIRQYRYPVDQWGWEVPAGSLYDHEGSLEDLARRELMEEVGATCEALEYIDWFYGAVSASDTVCHVTLALGTRLMHTPQREATEFIEIHPTPVEEVISLARNGGIRDGRSALALLLCEPYLEPWKRS